MTRIERLRNRLLILCDVWLLVFYWINRV